MYAVHCSKRISLHVYLARNDSAFDFKKKTLEIFINSFKITSKLVDS